MPKLYEATFEIPTYRTIKIALPGHDPEQRSMGCVQAIRVCIAAAWENAVADCDGRCDVVDIREVETEAA